MSNINPINSKADKVTSATSGNLAALDANGNITDSGNSPASFATSSAISGKADKVVGATAGHLAALDSSGNLVDSGSAGGGGSSSGVTGSVQLSDGSGGFSGSSAIQSTAPGQLVVGNGSTQGQFAYYDDGGKYVTFQAAGLQTTGVAYILPTDKGTSGQVLSTDGGDPTQLSWVTAGGGGGGGSPGGSNTQLQYNSAGSFAGDTATTDGAGNITASSINVGGGGITADSITAPVGTLTCNSAFQTSSGISAGTVTTTGDLWVYGSIHFASNNQIQIDHSGTTLSFTGSTNLAVGGSVSCAAVSGDGSALTGITASQVGADPAGSAAAVASSATSAAVAATVAACDASGSAATAQSNAESYANGLAGNYDAAGTATAAISAAISALGLGTASTHAATDFDAAGTASAAISALNLGTASTYNIGQLLQSANNLSDVANATTAINNLGGPYLTPTGDGSGLSGVATTATINAAIAAAASSYDPAGSASTAQSNAQSFASGLASNYDAAGTAAAAVAAAASSYDPAGSAAAISYATLGSSPTFVQISNGANWITGPSAAINITDVLQSLSDRITALGG